MTDPQRKIGEALNYLDKTYHHHHHGPLGWVFCDLLDYYYGQTASALIRDRRQRSGILSLPLSATSLLALKMSNQRIKWGEPNL